MSNTVKEIETKEEFKEMETKELPAEKEVKKEGIMTKAKNGIKKHGKTALKVAGIAGLTVLGFALGVKFGEGASIGGYSEDEVEPEGDVIDAPDYSEEYAE